MFSSFQLFTSLERPQNKKWEMGEVFSPVEEFEAAMENAKTQAAEDNLAAQAIAETDGEREQREAEQ